MNSKQIKQALRLLGDRVERWASWAMSGSSKETLSVEWINGGSQLFRTIGQVKDYVNNRDMVKQ